jgi:hypothetical protein
LATGRVWPSGQTHALFSSLSAILQGTQAADRRAPHLVAPDEIEDGISILTNVPSFFLWDCHVLTASGRDVVFVSHDEFGWFGSRDGSVAASVSQQLKRRAWRGFFEQGGLTFKWSRRATVSMRSCGCGARLI